MSLRITITTQFPEDVDSPSGGVEAVSVNLVRGLASMEGCEVSVVTTGKGIGQHSRVKWEGAEIHYLPWAGGSTLAHAIGPGRRQFSRVIRSLKPDVVHAHDTYGMHVARLDIPKVLTIHGFIHVDTRFQAGRFSGLRARIWEVLEKRVWARQRDIVSINPYVSEQIRELVTARMHEIDNPIDQRFFGVRRRRAGNRVFSVAHISRLKNTLGLLQAFGMVLKQVPDAELIIAGTATEDGYLERVRCYIDREGLEQSVHLLGAISTDRVLEEVSMASVLAHVSLQENAPMCIAEAMASGVPVVATNQFGIPHMVSDGSSGYLIDPSEPGEIADRLVRVLSDGSLNDRMSKAGRLVALDRFLPEAVARKTLDAYRLILGEGERRAS